MSRLDMAENPAQANIQGFELHIVKNNNNGQNPTVPVLAENFTGGGAVLPARPDKGRADKRRISYADLLSDALTVDKNIHEFVAPDEPQIGL